MRFLILLTLTGCLDISSLPDPDLDDMGMAGQSGASAVARLTVEDEDPPFAPKGIHLGSPEDPRPDLLR